MVDTDSGYGFLAWEDSLRGGPLNSILVPDANDISQDTASFVTWWAPGQYAFVGMVSLLGLSFGQALPLSVLLACLCAGTGWYRFGKSIGLETRHALLLATAELLCYHVLHNFGAFFGGEVVIQAALPWFMLAAWVLRERPQRQMLILPFLLLGAAFLKHSFLMQMLGIPLFWLIDHGVRCEWKTEAVFRRAIGLGLAVLAAAGVWYFFFLSKGSTPAMPGQQVPIASSLGFCLIGPWFAATGFAALLGRYAFLHNASYDAVYLHYGWLLLVVGLAASVFLFVFLKHKLAPSVARLLVSVYLGNVVLLAFLLLCHAQVSLEDRHLYTAGALGLAALVAVLPKLSSLAASLSRLALCAMMLAGVGTALVRAQRMQHFAPVSIQGFAQHQLSPAVLMRIQELDLSEPSSTLFIVPAPEMALEIRRHRRWTLELGAQDSRSTRYHGVVSKLVVLEKTQTQSAPEAAPRWAACFAGYPTTSWKSERLGEWTLWTNDAGRKESGVRI